MNGSQKIRRVFDPIYGFISLTPVGWEIIHSPFYQRLRWIKQLGFSFYLFPGAEHSRFGHSIGVMHNAHKILESCGKAVAESDLMSSTPKNKDVEFHQAIHPKLQKIVFSKLNHHINNLNSQLFLLLRYLQKYNFFLLY